MSFAARFAGRCTRCGRGFPKGAQIEWDSSSRTARHASCGAPGSTREPGDESEQGETPGALPEPAQAPRKPRRRVSLANAQQVIDDHIRSGAEPVERDAPDVVTCAHCGTSAAGREMVHRECVEQLGDVPF